MGWCSATYIFDAVAEALLEEDAEISKKDVIRNLIKILEDNDWDCQYDSRYIDHPVVAEIMRELHPSWEE